ncbi:MAG: nitroreductase family protein [Eubacteriales bacterium]|nr:nitroreductase family protein [Eubacteriales bacterium]
MNWLQLIERRVSVRQYEPDVDEATLAQVRKICEHAKSYNSSALKYFLLPGSEVHRRQKSIGPIGRVLAPWYIAAVAAGDSEALFNLGYSSQRVILELTALDLGTCWLGALFDREALGDSLGLGKGHAVRALIAWGRGRKVPGTADKQSRRLPSEKIAFFAGDRDTRYPWRTVLEAVRWAPSAINRQPWRLWFGAGAVHLFSKPGRLARSFAPIDMGIALCHLELACKQLAIPGSIAQTEHPQRKGWEYWVSYIFD